MTNNQQTTSHGLIELRKFYNWQGDQMRCTCCKRAIHVTRKNDELVHQWDCKNKDKAPKFPWTWLERLLSEVL